MRVFHCRWFSMERVTGLMLRFAKPNPPSQAQSGEFLKTLHWSVFLTEFHLIGSSPCSCSNGKRQRVCSVAARLSMERVTGLEPANTSLGSSCLTTWRHPHQVSDYTLSIRKGVEGFPEGSIFYVFPALKRRAALYFCPWGALSPSLVLLATSRLSAGNVSPRFRAACRCCDNEILA